jgi:hypothetical protein
VKDSKRFFEKEKLDIIVMKIEKTTFTVPRILSLRSVTHYHGNT